MPFFLAGSPAQLLESLADLTSLPAAVVVVAAPALSPGLAPVFATVLPAAGLCKVPLITGSGFFATITGFAGADIMLRIAAASASALRRRSPKSFTRSFSATISAFESATPLATAAISSLAISCALSLAASAACAFASAAFKASSAAFSAFGSASGTILFPARLVGFLTTISGAGLETGMSTASLIALFCSSACKTCSSRKRRCSISLASSSRIAAASCSASFSRRSNSDCSNNNLACSEADNAAASAASVDSSRWMSVRFLRTST